MNTNRFSLPIALAITIAGALVVVSPPSLAQCPDFVVGTWEWEYSDGGFAGEHRTPASMGYTLQLEYLVDGTVKYYKDEVLEYSAIWEMSCTGPTSGTLSYSPEYYPSQQAYTEDLPDGLRLHLDDMCIDCFASRYIERGPIGPIPLKTMSWGVLKSVYGD